MVADGQDQTAPLASQNKVFIFIIFQLRHGLVPQVLVSEKKHWRLIFHLQSFLSLSKPLWSWCCNTGSCGEEPSVCFQSLSVPDLGEYTIIKHRDRIGFPLLNCK